MKGLRVRQGPEKPLEACCPSELAGRVSSLRLEPGAACAACPLPSPSFSISGMVTMGTEASGQEQWSGTGQLGMMGGPGRRAERLLSVHPAPTP